MNRYVFQNFDVAKERVFSMEVSENGSLYLISCSCGAPNYRKCDHVLSVLTGNSEYLKPQGITNQKELIQRLMSFSSGFELINSARLKKGLSPYCNKCKQPTDTVHFNDNFIGKLLNRYRKEYQCRNCNKQ